MQHKKNPAANIFGIAPKPKARGGYKVDISAVLSPIEDKEAVIRVFCTGCGKYIPINKEGAEDLAKQAGEDLPVSLSGMYFESSKCVFCSKNNQFSGISLNKA